MILSVDQTTSATHFYELDRAISGGLPLHSLTVVGGRPAIGKTALMLNMAENLAFKSGKKVLFVTRDLCPDTMKKRILASQTGIECEKLFGQMPITSEEKEHIEDCVKGMERSRNDGGYIDCTQDIDKIFGHDKFFEGRYGYDVIFLDYLQLYLSEEKENDAISAKMIALKVFALEHDVAIVVSSQLTRKVEERTGHRPMLTDLRGSGTIEEIADIVLFVYRREYYDPLDKPGMAEIIIAKNKFGNVGSAVLTFRREIAQFANYKPTMQYED